MATRKRVVEAPSRKRVAPQVKSIKVLVRHDEEEPDTSHFDSGDKDQDEAYLERYENGDFIFVGVRAEAEVVVDGVIQLLTSGGLWGIESDSGKEYFAEVGADEWSDLRQILKTIGVATAQLPTEFNPEWIEWRT